jgi:hypothetical protein
VYIIQANSAAQIKFPASRNTFKANAKKAGMDARAFAVWRHARIQMQRRMKFGRNFLLSLLLALSAVHEREANVSVHFKATPILDYGRREAL